MDLHLLPSRKKEGLCSPLMSHGRESSSVCKHPGANPLLPGALCSPYRGSLGPPERTPRGRSTHGERFSLHLWWRADKRMGQLYISGPQHVRHRRGPSTGCFVCKLGPGLGGYKVMGRKSAFEAAQSAPSWIPQDHKSKPQITLPFPWKPAPL